LTELSKITNSVRNIIIAMGTKDDSVTLHVADDDSLIDSGLIDSIVAIQLIEVLSDKFDIIIYPAELSLDNFDTVNRISLFLQSKLNGEDT